MVAALREGQLDLIVNYLYPAPAIPEDLAQEYLYDDVAVVCASMQHRFAGLARVTMEQLGQEWWVLPGPQIPHVQWLFKTFHDHGLPPPRIRVETHPLRLRLQTVASSDLLGFISRHALQQAAPRFHLKELPVKELLLRRPVGVIYRKDGYLPHAVRRLIEKLKATAQEPSPAKKG